MKLIRARNLGKPWRIGAVVIAIACIICTCAIVALDGQISVDVSPFVPALLAPVFGLVAVSGRAPV